ncbi:MAG: hypothetical protein SNJ52_03180 [Verrucomicrobiia bacterium]
MNRRSLPALFLVSLISQYLVPCAKADVLLVDGALLPGRVLFEHPNAPLLIVESLGRRTLQSIPLAEVQSYDKDGQTVQVNAPRALTDAEKERRSRNVLWGDQVGPGQIGRYATEEWEQAPILVWAHPGRSDNGTLPENWLDRTGRPLSESPWAMSVRQVRPGRDEGSIGVFNGDILLPRADQPYEAILDGAQHVFRHLTLEANATISTRYAILGNIWIKDGGRLNHLGTGSMGTLGGRGIRRVDINLTHLGHDKHLFARFDNYHDVPQPAFAYLPQLSHWMFADAGAGSLEIIGITRGAGDRMNYAGGEIIISTDSHFGNGDRAAAAIQPGATVVLLDGASFGNHLPIGGGSGGKQMASYGIAGTLMFGHPEKPLTRDLDFLSRFYPEEMIDPQGRTGDRAAGASIVLGESGSIVMHTSDPQKARVIFRPLPKEWMILRGEVQGEDFWAGDNRPTGIAAVFRGQTAFNGVQFDGFYKGGIVVDPEARARWQNVTFGPNNQAPPEELFRALHEE